MGNDIMPAGGQSSYIMSGKNQIYESYNTRVALWQLPYSDEYLKYDTDGNKWFDSDNESNEDEIQNAERGLKINMDRYKVRTKTAYYNDATYDVESKYPNKMTVKEKHGNNNVFVWIKDKFDRLVAEKVFNGDSHNGRKTVYKNIKQGENVFTIVKNYSYDTTKNRTTDIVNFAYTTKVAAFIKGCTEENEYYLLNGQQVDAKKSKDGEYKVKDKNGKVFKFKEE